MAEWWQSIGEPSLIAGGGLGLVWAMLSTWRRRHRYGIRGLRAPWQIAWFAFALAGMGSYLTLVAAIGLLGIYDILPQEAIWLMLGAAVLAFSAALLHGRFDEPRSLTEWAGAEAVPPASKAVPKVVTAAGKPQPEVASPPTAVHG